MNLPNKLSLLRMILVPVFMVVLALPGTVLPLWLSSVIGTVIFIVASITDCLDGKIARKYNLITDFGKLIDPLADKFMVIGALIMILYRANTYRALFVLALTVVVFRELAVTAMRLITASKSGVAVPANMLGKIKTVSQIVFVIAALIEPLLYPVGGASIQVIPVTQWARLAQILPLTLLSGIVMSVFTVWSGIHYIVALWKYIETK
ncbi:MAG: CDP-diacylglycerol--glycerol-3-phosphate 3-phosphatidyltransferase [Clostridia bacterium]|nr:CDP-diacylglycerol--glycerol-3-phosphate 3-phosphatidyltransferase [Clostridia bacterium]